MKKKRKGKKKGKRKMNLDLDFNSWNLEKKGNKNLMDKKKNFTCIF